MAFRSVVALAALVELIAAVGQAQVQAQAQAMRTVYPLVVTNCGLSVTYDRAPTAAVTLNQGATEVMLALGLEGSMAGTAYLDDAIWPKYESAFLAIPQLDRSAPSYPDVRSLSDANTDFLYGAYNSAFRQSATSIDYESWLGLPCTTPDSRGRMYCRKELRDFGVGSYLQEPACEDPDLRPDSTDSTGVLSLDVLLSEIRTIGRIFDVQYAAEKLIATIEERFTEAVQTYASSGLDLSSRPSMVWLDSVGSDTSNPFVGACCGAPGMVMDSAGAVNIYAQSGLDVSASWVRGNWTDILNADPDVAVLVEASWDRAEDKLTTICNSATLRTMSSIPARQFIVVPFSGSTLGVRLGEVALHLSQAVQALTAGSALPQKDWQLVNTPPQLPGSTVIRATSGVLVYTALPTALEAACPAAVSPPTLSIAPTTGRLTGLRRQDGEVLDIDFVFLADNPVHRALESDVRDYLALQGFSVRARPLEKDVYNQVVVNGDFNLAFSETWGAPYDPHSFVASFRVPDEASFSAQHGMEHPMTKKQLDAAITAVLSETDEAELNSQWATILGELHSQAIYLPLTRLQNVAVMNKRLSGFRAGLQQFDIPLTGMVAAGNKTLTISPAAQAGLFNDVGRMNPHAYRPNEFFANDWVYEGLVGYGPDGSVLPALATSWNVTINAGGNQSMIFELRRGVTFHDGAAWNADACRRNFDHAFHVALRTPDYHGWYELALRVTSWQVLGPYTFALHLTGTYAPAMQELTFIRPMRMLSPNMLPAAGSHSCPAGWGMVGHPDGTANCAGIRGIAGTGPWRFVEKKTNQRTLDATAAGTTDVNAAAGETVEHVLYGRFDAHWGGLSDIEQIKVVRYATQAEVRAALESGALDMAYGVGPLTPQDFSELHAMATAERAGTGPAVPFYTHIADPLNTRAIVINSAKFPTSDVAVRKAIVHAVNKQAIIDAQLFGLEASADTLFSRSLPYCDVDLFPIAGYDEEKSGLLLEFAGWSLIDDQITDLESFIRTQQGTALLASGGARKGSAEERAGLLAVKAAITQDPFGVLNSWQEGTDPCTPPGWTGVTCGCDDVACKVVKIDLGSAQLVGTIAPEIGNLINLHTLWLNANGFTGTIPSTLAQLRDLQSLSLRGNLLSGALPDALFRLPKLRDMLLQLNRFSGPIPPAIGQLSQLDWLDLRFNRLTGPLPSQLGSLSQVTQIGLTGNDFTGSIPLALAQLGSQKLNSLVLRGNDNLAPLGTDATASAVRSALDRISTVVGIPGYVRAAANSQPTPASDKQALLAIKAAITTDFYGLLGGWTAASDPCDDAWEGVGCTCSATVCRVTRLDLGSGNLEGTLAPEVGDLAELVIFWVNGNRLRGSLPVTLGNLVRMASWSTRGNFFEGPFPSTLSFLTQLTEVLAQYNFHTGPIPEGLRGLPLNWLDLSFNRLSGALPAWPGELTQLTYLAVAGNDLTGKIPADISRLANQNLQTLDLRENPLVRDINLYSEEELLALSSIPSILVSEAVAAPVPTTTTAAPVVEASNSSDKDYTGGDLALGIVLTLVITLLLVGLILLVVRRNNNNRSSPASVYNVDSLSGFPIADDAKQPAGEDPGYLDICVDDK